MQYHLNQFDSLDAELQHFNQLYNTNSNILDKYLSVSEFSDGYKLSSNASKTVSVLHWNVRSLLAKMDQITCEIKAMSGDFDVICLCETWITGNTVDLANLNNYGLIPCS